MADITAARHNSLQSRIALIYGSGAGQNGYGQALQSYQVSTANNKIIEAADINAIYKDIVNARIHQTGQIPSGISEVIPDRNVIAEDVSYEVSDQGITTTGTNDSAKGIADFEALMTIVENDKFLLHPTQAATQNLISNSRSAPWNGTIVFEFSVNFDDENHRRHFFNAGGELRFTLNNSGATLPKGLDWNSMLQNIGTITFNYSTTNSSGKGTGSSIGNYDLTEVYQLIFSHTGSGVVYGGNDFKIRAKAFENTVTFQVEFQDIVQVSNVDNNVDGNLTVNVQQYYADSEEVSINTPQTTTIQSLSQYETPPEEVDEEPAQPIIPITYALTANKTEIDEGDVVIFTLTTTGIPNGSTVAFGLSGTANTLDVVLSDTVFVVQNNTATITVQAAQDATTEGNETLTMYVVNSPSTTATVTIQDTSLTEVEQFAFTIDETQYLSTNPGWDIGNVTTGSSAFIEITLRGVSGTGIVTVQETSRPSAWTVGVDDDFNGDQVGEIASKNYTLSAGETQTVRLTVQPQSALNFRTIGRYFSFAALKSDGTGNKYTIYWTGAGVSAPSYALYSNELTVYEGGTALFRMETENVALGTQVPFEISGVTSADIDEVLLTGTFTVGALASSSTGTGDSITLFVNDDDIAEFTETLTLTINPPNAEPVSQTIEVRDPLPIPAGTLSATPTTTNIELPYSSPATLDFNLTASSTGPVTINSLSEFQGPTDFDFEAILLDSNSNTLTLPYEVSANETVQARVNLNTPSSDFDAASGTALYVQTDSNNLVLPINWRLEVVTPVLTLEPTSFSYNSEYGEYTRAQRVTLRASDATVTVNSYKIWKRSGDGVASFSLLAPSRDVPFDISPGNSVFWDVTQQFNVGEEAEYEIYLDTNIGIKTIPISWNKTTPAIPNYTITPDKLNYREGETATFTIERDIAPTNNLFYPNLIFGSEPMNINDFEDFVGQIAEGFVSMPTGTLSTTFDVTLASDLTVEGTETFGLALYKDGAKTDLLANSRLVNVGDATTPATYRIDYVNTHPIYDNIVGERNHQTAVFTVTTTGVPNGTELFWYTSQLTAGRPTADDFSDNTLTGSVTINNNTATIIRTVVADNLTEGPEIFRIGLRTGSQNGPKVAFSRTIGISDTSTLAVPYLSVINQDYAFSSKADVITDHIIQVRAVNGDVTITKWVDKPFSTDFMRFNVDGVSDPDDGLNIAVPEGQVVSIPVQIALRSEFQSSDTTTLSDGIRLVINDGSSTSVPWNVTYNRIPD